MYCEDIIKKIQDSRHVFDFFWPFNHIFLSREGGREGERKMRQKKEKWKREAHGERGGMREVEVEVKGEE